MKNLIVFVGALTLFPIISEARGVPTVAPAVPGSSVSGRAIPGSRPRQRLTAPDNLAFPGVMSVRPTEECPAVCAQGITNMLVSFDSLQGQSPANDGARSASTTESAVTAVEKIRMINRAGIQEPDFMDIVLPGIHTAGRKMTTTSPESSAKITLTVNSLSAASYRAVNDNWDPATKQSLATLIRDIVENGVTESNRQQVEEINRHCNFRQI